MPITINTNVASLQTQRRLAESTSRLSQCYQRLSSGLRITKASDDAAGLSIASSLNVDARVYNQGVRNLNDGVSVFNIAEGAVDQLTNIVIRVEELAEQASNGTLGSRQRAALDAEGQALRKEYLRIAQTTEFNGKKLFDGNNGEMTLQAGYGADGQLWASTGGKMGTGSFGANTTIGSSDWGSDLIAGDFNGDGIIDLVTADYGGNTVSMFIGTGGGSFKTPVSYAAGNSPDDLEIGDLDGNGVMDIVVKNYHSTELNVLLGRSDGTFAARMTYALGASTEYITLNDFNGDNYLDVATRYEDVAGKVNVAFGRGDGSFGAYVTFAGGSNPFSIDSGDLNGDGFADIVTVGGSAYVLLSQGNGSFSSGVTYAVGSASDIDLVDVNNDNKLDLVGGKANGGGNEGVVVALGNGDGSFAGPVSYTIGIEGSYRDLTTGDFNGDGFVDVSGLLTSCQIGILLGNGDGSFSAPQTFTPGTGSALGLLAADLNGDGVQDLGLNWSDNNTVNLFLGLTRNGVAPLLPFSLKTKGDAKWALELMKQKLTQLSAQRGTIGANQSRISVATSVLTSSSENFSAAESRIRDADIADESANLTRTQIIQQAAASVLAQANQQPALALALLQS